MYTVLQCNDADLSELDLPPQVALSFPHGMSHSQLFEVAMTPGALAKHCRFAAGRGTCLLQAAAAAASECQATCPTPLVLRLLHSCAPHPWAPCLADEGCYAGGTFLFQFRVPDSYPADPPRVRCLTQVGFGRA